MTDQQWRAGQRVLIKEPYAPDRYPAEVTVKEVSPDGQYVKLAWHGGAEKWHPSNAHRILSVLEAKDE